MVLLLARNLCINKFNIRVSLRQHVELLTFVTFYMWVDGCNVIISKINIPQTNIFICAFVKKKKEEYKEISKLNYFASQSRFDKHKNINM